MSKYTIGIDYGSLSGRAVLVRCDSGEVVAESTMDYPHAVMDAALSDGTPLGQDWALQDPPGLSGRARYRDPRRAARERRGGGRRDRRGHGLHRLHRAPRESRRHAAVLPPPVPLHTQRLCEAVEAPRRGKIRRPGDGDRRPAGRAVPAALWRQNFQRVGNSEDLADSGRKPGSL